MKRNYYFISLALVLHMSCSDKTVRFYKLHAKQLEILASSIAANTKIKDVCCIKDSCFNLQMLELMKELKLECIRKDTSEGTVNFILIDKKKKLESTEIIYQYNKSLQAPQEYPNAGISITKIAQSWFIRKYQFD